MNSVERGKVVFYTEPNFEGIYVIYKEGESSVIVNKETTWSDTISSIKVGQGVKLFLWEFADKVGTFLELQEGEYPNIMQYIKSFSKFQILKLNTNFAVDVRFFDLISNEFHNHYTMTFKLADIEELEIKSGETEFKLLNSRESDDNEVASAIFIKRPDNLFEPISNLIFQWDKNNGIIRSITDDTNFAENLSIIQNDNTSFTFTLKSDGIGYSHLTENPFSSKDFQLNSAQ